MSARESGRPFARVREDVAKLCVGRWSEMDGNLPGALQQQLARTLFSPFAFLANVFAAALASTSPVTATTVLPRLVNSGHEPRPVVPGQKETPPSGGAGGLLRHHLSLLFADDLAHSVLGFRINGRRLAV